MKRFQFTAQNVENLVTTRPKELNALLDELASHVKVSDIRWVVAKLAKRNFIASISGEFIDSISNQKMRLNHIKCMLLKDYQKEINIIQGKPLHFMLEYSLIKILACVKKKYELGLCDDLFFEKKYDGSFLDEVEI